MIKTGQGTRINQFDSREKRNVRIERVGAESNQFVDRILA